MGNKDKKHSRQRSRSRSRERRKHKHEKEKRRKRTPSDSSDSDSSDSSMDRRKHKSKHKHRSRSRSRDGSRKRNRDRDREENPLEKFKALKEMGMSAEERRKQKELLKTLETPEEKRARRLAKKDMKERKRKAQMGWDEEYMGYTNEDNPFGDERLLDTFVWGKKAEKEGRPVEDFHKTQREKMEETKRELEKVKRRRLEREKERQEREKQREIEQREKESEYYSAWERQEDTFHLEQAKLRSKIRIEDGRAKPIDLLAKYISAEDEDMSLEMHEPYTYLNGLTIDDLEDLLEDIQVYTEMEQGKNQDYWRDITIITEDELNKLRKIDPGNRDYVGDRRAGINQSVTTDVANVFKGKTHKQLLLLEQQIKKKLRGGEGVDVGYWESLLQQLKAHMARSRLRERHQQTLKSKLLKLKEEQGIENESLFPIIKQEIDEDSDKKSMPPPSSAGSSREEPGPSSEAGPSDEAGPSNSKEIQDEDEEEEEGPEESILTEEDLMEQSYDEYTFGGYSPKLLKAADLEADVVLYDPEEDMRRLEYLRLQVKKTGGRALTDTERESEFEKKAREGMNDDEATFSVEVALEQSMAWSDKYRPRKPRFFNRVHTGFEWNKYNQTHYDIDNPPPKIVQGYKFNIFYPDLIEKTKTPEFHVTPCEDSKDFCVLKFHAGPPYEDIAFKIVNREWECSYKKGFRCQFHNNIFQLWFHFKRYRYRR